MALPSGYSIKSLFDQHHPGPIFQVVSDILSKSVANIFSMPSSLLNTTGDQAMIRHDKEVYLAGSFYPLVDKFQTRLTI